MIKLSDLDAKYWLIENDRWLYVAEPFGACLFSEHILYTSIMNSDKIVIDTIMSYNEPLSCLLYLVTQKEIEKGTSMYLLFRLDKKNETLKIDKRKEKIQKVFK